jgi:nitrogen fixation NifU-like protein
VSDLEDLYQEVILDHGRRPRNYHKLEGADRSAEGRNPLCGDHLTLYLRLDGGRIAEAAFEGQGCAISKASASLLTAAVKGLSVEDAEALFRDVHRLVTEGPAQVDAARVGKLAVLSGVSEFPTRVKCASLAWHTLHNALRSDGHVASTE